MTQDKVNQTVLAFMQFFNTLVANSLEEIAIEPATVGQSKIALGRKEAAESLDMSVAKFDRLRSQQGFPKPITLDGRPRWLSDDLRKWASKQPRSGG